MGRMTPSDRLLDQISQYGFWKAITGRDDFSSHMNDPKYEALRVKMLRSVEEFARYAGARDLADEARMAAVEPLYKGDRDW